MCFSFRRFRPHHFSPFHFAFGVFLLDVVAAVVSFRRSRWFLRTAASAATGHRIGVINPQIRRRGPGRRSADEASGKATRNDVFVGGQWRPRRALNDAATDFLSRALPSLANFQP